MSSITEEEYSVNNNSNNYNNNTLSGQKRSHEGSTNTFNNNNTRQRNSIGFGESFGGNTTTSWAHDFSNALQDLQFEYKILESMLPSVLSTVPPSYETDAINRRVLTKSVFCLRTSPKCVQQIQTLS